MDTISYMERKHGCSPQVAIGTKDSAVWKSNQLFQNASAFWSPLQLSMVSSETNHFHDNHENDTTIVTVEFNLSVVLENDAQRIAVLRTESHEDKKRMSWTAIVDQVATGKEQCNV
jgi:hypothetical protein